jgi:sugar phosphate isomerase/epimerase
MEKHLSLNILNIFNNSYIMKKKAINYQNFTLFFLFALLLVFISCITQPFKKSLVFKDYPNLKIGFSTQNFHMAMPVNVESLTEIIEYASKEGYQFIELRDDLAKLTAQECEALAEVARKNKIDVIYEIHKNPLDSGYFEVFTRGLANTLLFPGPGILRTVISKSEFGKDESKKGWTKEELTTLTRLADSCALIAKAKNIQFIVENFNEPFFSDSLTYFGLNDFFAKTSGTGFQFDVSNAFSKTSRQKADPEKVLQYLSSLGNRWVTTHLKTIQVTGGVMQPVLTENPLAIEKVVALMGQKNITYAALELASVDDKQQCFNNHAASIQFLKDKGILK